MKDFFFSNVPAALYMLIIIVMSLVLFIMMGIDKHRARLGQFRIPEARLFLLALLGGGLGGWIGMYAFRHKTKHLKFVLLFPVIALIQLIGFFCLYLFQ